MSEQPPIIGISGEDKASGSLRSMVAQVQAMGGIPLVLSNHTDARRDPSKDIEKIDALIVMGNDADLDPSTYRQEAHPKTHSEMATKEGQARALYEFSIMDKALSMGMPVLGVCAGMHRLNVLCGGDLHQHIPDLIGNEEHEQDKAGIAPYVPVVPVVVKQGSRLSGIADEAQSYYMPAHSASGDNVFMENSFHHQAVNTVGKGLIDSAHSTDEVTYTNGTKKQLVEAIEADPNGPFKDQFVLGVQWHPEFAASDVAPKIVGTVVGEGKKFAKEHNREHAPEETLVENAVSTEQNVKPLDENAANPPRPGSWTEAIQRDRRNRQTTFSR